MSIPTVKNFPTDRIPVEGNPSFREDASYVWSKMPAVINSFNSAIAAINTTSGNIANYSKQVENNAKQASQAALSAKASANFKGAWDSTALYKIGDSVLGSNSVFYVCMLNNTGNNPTLAGTAFWVVNVPMGAVGRLLSPLLDLPLKNSLAMKAGVGSVTFTNGYVLETAYDSGATYATGDKASYGGFNYVSKQDSNSGNTPANGSDYWQISAPTYIDRYGMLNYVGVDEARFEKEGLLIEGSSTNLSLYSEEFDNDAWIKAHSTIDTASDVKNPYGEDGVQKITWDGNTDNNICYAAQAISIDDDDSIYTFSAFVKQNTTNTCTIYMNTSGGTGETVKLEFDFIEEKIISGTGTVKKLSNGWFRLSQTLANNSSGNTSIRGKVDITFPHTDGDSVYAFGGQIEKLPFASSYIPTVDSVVTRGRDTCDVSNINNTPNTETNKEGFSIAYNLDILGRLTGTQYSFMIGRSTNNLAHYFLGATSFRSQVKNAIDTIIAQNANMHKDVNVIVSSVSNTEVKTSISYVGDTEVENTTNVLTGGYTNTLETFRIGGHCGGNTNRVFGHMSNFRVYDFLLTCTETALLGGKQ